MNEFIIGQSKLDATLSKYTDMQTATVSSINPIGIYADNYSDALKTYKRLKRRNFKPLKRRK